MSSSDFEPQIPGTWSWPDDVPKEDAPEARTSESASFGQRRTAPSFTSANTPPRSGPNTRSSRRTHWPPRQCRICLDVVQPTFDVPSEHLPGFLQSSGNVKYEDESGRLIRPCLCKGSSKYVHDGCLQAWRHADPGYGRRNYWQCPTCHFKYRLVRLGAGRFVASAGKSYQTTPSDCTDQSLAAQVIMTIAILVIAVFVLGFIADPIINLYLDPGSFLSPWSSSDTYYYEDDERFSWSEHFAKGFASMGVFGFLKVFLANPFYYFRFGGGRTRNTGRERHEQVSWILILIGVGTFLMVSLPCLGQHVDLTFRRLHTKGSEYCVAAHLYELESASWTCRVMKMMTKMLPKTSKITSQSLCTNTNFFHSIRVSSTDHVLVPVLGPHIFKLSWFLLCTEPISLRAKIKSLRSPTGLHVLCGRLGPLCYRLWHFRYRHGPLLERNSMASLKQCCWHMPLWALLVIQGR
jgi:hypothetical protein